MSGCFNCDQDALILERPVRDRVYVSDTWRIAHAWSALPGWLVLISRRHVLSAGELTEREAAELGQLLRDGSAALAEVVGCEKTYVAMFAEQPGFEHLHFHLIPRMADFGEQHLGAGAFDFLKRPEEEWVAPPERDRLARLVAHHLRPPDQG